MKKPDATLPRIIEHSLC